MSDIFRENEVGNRYAKAIFELARDGGALEAVYKDFATLKALITESADLRRVLGSQAFASDLKLKGLLAVAKKAKLNALTTKALNLMGQKGRLDQLAATIAGFNSLYAAHKGIVTATVTSAVALDDGQLKNLKAELAKALGREADITTLVDPAILGGLKVRVGSRLFDASLKTKLNSLKFALKRA
ncbi:F0F1 ATP synthase subunit delta [Asticcacaulis sp. ZE23SCel15]|uniref:F0F1 ATP synthase subunit delta n=1 Tax=Asticcacaulis sp. ZE23SCel15 TaxID=3059027 RepID=UPI00265D981D|nr:F0F1 ATP synthase subunit delta [Asticcacaulis sp. ZE23SCel15]WKL58160.1 F0F1 ATP synthase subunit delta [Asticcacaulis sp. ZE23SCel15]